MKNEWIFLFIFSKIINPNNNNLKMKNKIITKKECHRLLRLWIHFIMRFILIFLSLFAHKNKRTHSMFKLMGCQRGIFFFLSFLFFRFCFRSFIRSFDIFFFVLLIVVCVMLAFLLLFHSFVFKLILKGK